MAKAVILVATAILLPATPRNRDGVRPEKVLHIAEADVGDIW